MDMKSVVDRFIDNLDLNENEILKFGELLQKNADAKIYFHAKLGSKKLIQLLENNKKSAYFLINVFVDENFIY